MRARYYEPRTGRFTSKDPVSGYVQVPQSLHIYVYAWNRPTVLRDPSGRQVPPQQCPPGQICASGTTGPYVLSMPPPPGPYLINRPTRVGNSYLFPGDPLHMPEWQTLHTEYCRMPLWQVLHYYLPEHLYIRSEFYPVPVVEPEIPLAPGVQYQTETGYRHVTVYEPQLFPKPQLQVVGEYDETYTKHALGLGFSDVNVGGGFEAAPEYFGLWGSADIAYAEAEVQIGTDVILGTLYFEQPGWFVFGQSGWGVNVSTPVDRYLVAFEEDVERAGGHVEYGRKWLGPDYVFGGVKMQAYNKWILYANWSGQYHDPNMPNDPEWLKIRLEEFP